MEEGWDFGQGHVGYGGGIMGLAVERVRFEMVH